MTGEPSQDNDTEQEDNKRRGTVSIRNMDLELWYKIGYKSKVEGITMTQYICRLLEQDISNQQ